MVTSALETHPRPVAFVNRCNGLRRSLDPFEPDEVRLFRTRRTVDAVDDFRCSTRFSMDIVKSPDAMIRAMGDALTRRSTTFKVSDIQLLNIND